ncbi:MAG: hypothetical protein GY841_00465 [FCB group bacterium]|nr:hypothetical protein [FCB group bacterium]
MTNFERQDSLAGAANCQPDTTFERFRINRRKIVRAVLKTILIMVMVTGLFGHSLGEDLIDVTAAVDKQTAFIGDLIGYTITITYDSTLRLTPPAISENLGGLKVKDVDVGNVQTMDGGRLREEIKLNLRSFTTGEFVIPPLAIEYMLTDSSQKSISVDRIKIEILSVLAEGTSPDSLEPRPNKGQISLSSNEALFYIILAAVILIIAAVIVYTYRRRQRVIEPEEEYVDPRPAWEIAFTALVLLKEKKLIQAGEITPFYVELSDIIRNYLGRQFGFDAIDMTTEEVADILTDLEIDDSFRNGIDRFLKHADLVKFAKYFPSADRPDQDWDEGYRLIDGSREMMPMRPIVEELPEVETADVNGEKREYSDLDYAPPELRSAPVPNSEEDTQ